MMLTFGGSISNCEKIFLSKSKEPFSLLCMRVYWDLLPRIIYFIIDKSKKKEFFLQEQKGGGRGSERKTGVIPKPACLGTFKTSCLGFDPGI